MASRSQVMESQLVGQKVFFVLRAAEGHVRVWSIRAMC